MANKERTEAQRRAEARYRDEKCDRIAILVENGKRDEWKAAAAALGLNLKRLVVCAVDGYIKNNLHCYQAKLAQIAIRIQADEYEHYKRAADHFDLPLRKFILKSMDEYIENHSI